MNIEQIIQEKQNCFSFKNIAPIKAKLDHFIEHKIKDIEINNQDTISIKGGLSKEINDELIDLLQSLKPWRKGPFELFDTLIDSEWKSFIKYDLIEPYLDIENKTVVDVGCNNGYYLFRMLDKKPKALIGIDPSALFYMQFALINHFIKEPIKYELLGIEHLDLYVQSKKLHIDTIICLGVLYHRRDPISSLKILSRSLKKGGTLILDAFIIDGDGHIALSPRDTYSKIPNIYFIPTIATLTNWLLRSGFEDIELIATSITTKQEQRKTSWIDAQSLEHFIDEKTQLTIEGYPRPKRGYVICKKK